MISSKASFVCALALLVSASLHAEEKSIIETLSEKALELREKGLAQLSVAEARLKVLKEDFKSLRAELTAEFNQNYLPRLQNLTRSGDVFLEAHSQEKTATSVETVVSAVAETATQAAPSNKSFINKNALFVGSSVIIAGAFCWLGYQFFKAAQEKNTDEQTA